MEDAHYDLKRFAPSAKSARYDQVTVQTAKCNGRDTRKGMPQILEHQPYRPKAVQMQEDLQTLASC